MAGARRAADLLRDPRVAVHCPTVDPPEDDPPAWEGDAKLAAHAVLVNVDRGPAEPLRFRLDLDRVVLTTVSADAEALDITVWRPNAAVTTVRRV